MSGAARCADNLLAGLSTAEARDRLASEGFNELPRERRFTLPRVVFGVIREPMFALLIAAATVYAVFGDIGESLLLLGFATISVSIAVIQRRRSERALEALHGLASPRALVIRDGQHLRIPGREVVRGDVVVLSEGDRVPADGVIVMGEHLEIDESLLTGESFAVHKSPALSLPARMSAPASAPNHQVFGGTLVIRGSGLAVIMAVGVQSAIGAIGQSLASVTREQPRLERETRRLVIGFGIAALVMCLLTISLYGLLRGAWMDALLGGIALGMALLPEEFPLVLTVFTVMGAWRLSRSRVLTRHASVIETLGAATVLCTDKTGTLTRNLMSVARLEAGDNAWEPQDPAERIAAHTALIELLETASLASDDHRVDPMERALIELWECLRPGARPGTMLREYPLRPELLAVTRVWSVDMQRRAATKGAPETIARLCGFDPAATAAQRARVEALAARGMRVLGVARATVHGDLPDSAGGFEFQYLGLVAFADPLRESVPEAVRECRAAGIRVVMITGDYPATARAIAGQAGIDGRVVVSGEELAALDDTALARRVRDTAVFARISPAQKLRIVAAFKANGEVVAMTGDGVNDAPALKAAHIGIAMGGRGTDVAREAASIVLLDDDFGSIVRGIRVGRRIYDNLRKAMGYIFAIHVPIAGLALLPVVAGWPLLLTPVLIALFELIIDPACSVVLEAEPEEAGVMQRPPRARDGSLLPRPLMAWCLVQGAAALAVVATIYVVAMQSAASVESVRTMAFLALVGANIMLIFVNRTFATSISATFGRPNQMLWWGLGVVAMLLTLIMVLPGVRLFFGLGPLHAGQLSICLGASVALLLVLELAKRVWRLQLER